MLAASGYAAGVHAKGQVLPRMDFSPEDLERLATHEAGWESVRDRLWVALEERLHTMILGGQPADPATWKVRPAFNMLPDADGAQSFICEFIVSLIKKADAEPPTLLEGFNGGSDKVLAYLAASDLVKKRALSYIALMNRGGLTGAPRDSSQAPRRRDIDGDDGIGEDLADSSLGSRREGSDPETRSVRISWDAEIGLDARVRMAALQCWPRLDVDQPGRSDLQSDLEQSVQPSSPGHGAIETLEVQHQAARIRLTQAIADIDQQIHDAPGMHARTRNDHEARRFGLQADRLLCPLLREQVQALLGLKTPEAAYKQLSRYRKAYPELFPGLLALCEDQVMDS